MHASGSRRIARAALGLRAHSGWAALVVLAGDADDARVVDRRRIEIANPAEAESKQPYHAIEGLSPAKAERVLARWAEDALERARAGLAEALGEARRGGFDVEAGAQLLASGRPLPGLDRVLASHALIHTADGEFFRTALSGAAARCRVLLEGIREKEIVEAAAAALGVDGARVRERVAALGRALGPPWTQDQKLAAMGAWTVLARATG